MGQGTGKRFLPEPGAVREQPGEVWRHAAIGRGQGGFFLSAQQNAASAKGLFQPGSESWHGREGTKGFQLREFGGQQFHHALDQEIAKGNAVQSPLAVIDGIEHRRIRLSRIQDWRFFIQQFLHACCHAAFKRDFNEDQWLIGHAWMEESVAAPI